MIYTGRHVTNLTKTIKKKKNPKKQTTIFQLAKSKNLTIKKKWFEKKQILNNKETEICWFIWRTSERGPRSKIKVKYAKKCWSKKQSGRSSVTIIPKQLLCWIEPKTEFYLIANNLLPTILSNPKPVSNIKYITSKTCSYPQLPFATKLMDHHLITTELTQWVNSATCTICARNI